MAREYEPWSEGRIIVDTGEHTVADCLSIIIRALNRSLFDKTT